MCRSRHCILWTLVLLQTGWVMSQMKDQFEKCCKLGTSWATEGLRCEKFSGPVSGVPRVEQGLCLEAVDICCTKAYREQQCKRGKDDARAGLDCTSLGNNNNNKSNATNSFNRFRNSDRGDYHRDCCEGCKLGILTGAMGRGCSFSFNFGSPWDPAFLECCKEALPTTLSTAEYSSSSEDFSSTGTSSSSSSTYSPDSSPSSLSSPESSSSSQFPSASSEYSSASSPYSSSSTTISDFPSDATSYSPSIPTPLIDDICQLMKGLLCADICIPTQGSYHCACREGFELLEDGKTCRQKSRTTLDSSNTPSFSNSSPDGDSQARCPSGYKYNAASQVCDDVDECSEKLDSCGDGEICYNQPGGYSCSRAPRPVPRRPSTPPLPAPADHKCQVGTRYVRNRGCVDVDECKDIPGACSSNENCVNVIGSFSCKCKIGFRRDNLTRACVDINECQLPDNGCLSTQRCDNTVGSYTCVRFLPCGTGYTLNAATEICEDDDECLLGTHDCGEGYNCRNTLGSYRCDKAPRSDRTRPTAALSHKTTTTTTTTMTTTTTPIPRTLPTVSSRLGVSCPHGLELSEEGSYCIDIDECRRQPRICGIMRCTNTIGSYRCAPAVLCSPGYKLDTSGNRCEDIDECSDGSHECGPKQTCENRPGAYLCSCPPGHTLDSVGKNCIDIDECSLYAGKICGYNSKCENTQGSYKCVCEKGFENVDLPGGTACQDIDECKIPGLCQQNCLNLLGGYRCACDRGFRLHSDNRSCTDIDECTEFKNNNLCIGICENTPGSYACKCPDGYKISEDGRICQDIDECESGRVCRGEDDNCQNLRGGFRCNRINCPPGYQKDPQKKNRCVRTSRYCNMGDLACYRIPAHYSYNYISFVSMYPIPSSGQLELFTMRGAHWADSTVQFSMALIDARAPPGVTRATESCFALRKPAPFQAVLVMTKSIQGPQEIELDLSMEIYHNEEFAGSAIAKLFIIVSQYDF